MQTKKRYTLEQKRWDDPAEHAFRNNFLWLDRNWHALRGP